MLLRFDLSNDKRLMIEILMNDLKPPLSDCVFLLLDKHV